MVNNLNIGYNASVSNLTVNKSVSSNNLNSVFNSNNQPNNNNLATLSSLNTGSSNNNEENKNCHLMIAVLCKPGVYLFYTNNVNMDYPSLVKQLKSKSNWFPLLIDQPKHQLISLDFSFDPKTNSPFSFVLVTDTMQLVTAEFNLYKEEVVPNTKDTKTNTTTSSTNVSIKEIIMKPVTLSLVPLIKDSSFPNDNIKILDFVGVSQKFNLIYIIFTKKILLFNLEKKQFLHKWELPTETIKDCAFIDSLIKQYYYFAAFVTNRNIWFSVIDSNLEVYEYDKSCGLDFFNTGMKINYPEKLCVVCNKPTNKRCMSCKEAFYCSPEHQEKDWNKKHKFYCMGVASEDIEVASEIIHIPETWSYKRKEIILHFKSCNLKIIKKGILLCCNILQQNKKYLNLILKCVPNLFKNNSTKTQSFINNFVSYFNILEDYMTNHFLWVYGNILINDKLEAINIINRFCKELEEKIEFKKVIDLLLEAVKHHSTKLDTLGKKNIVLLEEIFLRFIRLITTFGKMFFYLGEHEFFNNFIIEYSEKIENFCFLLNDSLLISHLYYHLGNLFIELDKLSYSITLYNEGIQELMKHMDSINKENSEIDLLISFHVNLGLVYFVTDQFKNSIVKLEKALKLCEEVKGEYFSDLTADIYEVIGEIHLEYKNYSESLTNLNKSLNIKTRIMQESPLKQAYHEKSLTKIFIMIDFINQMLIRNEEEEKANYNFKRKQQTNEMANKLGMNILKRTASNMLKPSNKSKLFNNNNDLFDYVSNIPTYGNAHFQNSGNNSIPQSHLITFPETLTNFFSTNKKSNFFNFHQSNIEQNKENYNLNSNNSNFPLSNNTLKTNPYKVNLLEKKHNLESIKNKSIQERKNHQLSQENRDEIEKFFIFISKLNQKQIDLLNLGQIHMNYNIPINFSPDFKNELKHVQKLELANFSLILLTRRYLLKNPTGQIEESNLNYDILYHQDDKNNISSIKNFFVTSKILKNWESSYRNNHSATKNIIGNINKMNEDMTFIDNKQLVGSIKPNDENLLMNNNNKLRDVFSTEKQLLKIDLNKKDSPIVTSNFYDATPKSNISASDINKKGKFPPSPILIRKGTKNTFDFEEFKRIIFGYIQQNTHSSTVSVFNKINENVLFKLSKTLSKQELDYLLKEPHIFYDFIDNQEILSSEESVDDTNDNKDHKSNEDDDDVDNILQNIKEEDNFEEDESLDYNQANGNMKLIEDFDTMKKDAI